MLTPARRLPVAVVAAALSFGIATLVRADDRTSGQGRTTVKSTLTKVKDQRRVILADHKADQPAFDFNKPALELTFELTAPQGKTLVNIEQPTEITATDSMNRDLTDVEAGFMGRKEFVQLVHNFEGPPNEMIFTLAPPNRSATYFNLSATFDVWAFDEIKEMTVDVRDGHSEAPELGEPLASIDVRKNGDSVELTVKPGTLRDRLEDIELIDGEQVHKNMGSMWSDAAATYYFPAETFQPEVKVRAKVRVGMEKFPCRVEVQKQPLP